MRHGSLFGVGRYVFEDINKRQWLNEGAKRRARNTLLANRMELAQVTGRVVMGHGDVGAAHELVRQDANQEVVALAPIAPGPGPGAGAGAGAGVRPMVQSASSSSSSSAVQKVDRPRLAAPRVYHGFMDQAAPKGGDDSDMDVAEGDLLIRVTSVFPMSQDKKTLVKTFKVNGDDHKADLLFKVYTQWFPASNVKNWVIQPDGSIVSKSGLTGYYLEGPITKRNTDAAAELPVGKHSLKEGYDALVQKSLLRPSDEPHLRYKFHQLMKDEADDDDVVVGEPTTSAKRSSLRLRGRAERQAANGTFRTWP